MKFKTKTFSHGHYDEHTDITFYCEEGQFTICLKLYFDEQKSEGQKLVRLLTYEGDETYEYGNEMIVEPIGTLESRKAVKKGIECFKALKWVPIRCSLYQPWGKILDECYFRDEILSSYPDLNITIRN